MRKTLLFLVFVCFSFFLSAQQLPKTVLWRITGKGLSKPSYLFGSMHLNDQRLFNFGDSVYRAIERCEGLAIELNPDELCAQMLTEALQEKENRKKLKDVLDEKDFKTYSEALSKKMGKPADEITTRDLVNEKNSWVQELMEKGEMSTFMDAWLYNVARRQGKWLGGIEDMSDQADLEEEMIDKSDVLYLLADDSTQDRESNDMLEQMVKIYVNQDLDGVQAISSYKSAKEKDLVLIKRNIKMARRMDSLTALRSMFLAVGLAHLPGDSGVIKLLQKRGFKVEPVFSKNKLAAKDYKFKEVQIPWVTVKDEQGLYTVQMPANPASVKHRGVVEMKFLFDLFNMSGFCTVAIVNPAMGNKDSMLNNVAAGFLQGKKPNEVKELNLDGMKGREYIHKSEDGHIRLQVHASDNVVYLVLMAGVKSQSLSSEDADKFFNSFTAHKYVSAPKGANTFTDSIMGITMQSQVKLTASKRFSPEDHAEFKITGFTGSESEDTYVMLFSREVRPGYYIVSDSITFGEFHKQMSSQYTDIKIEEGKLQGYPTMTLTGRNIEHGEIFAKAFSVLKDNKSLVLMVIADSVHTFDGSNDIYFNSLRFIDQPRIKWNFHNAPDKSYTIWTPTPLREHFEENIPFQIAYDTLSATTFFISVDTLDKYAWVESDSAFWMDMIGDNAEGLRLYKKTTKNGEFAGVETLIRIAPNGKVFTRMRIIPNGELIYKIFCAASEQYMNGENVDKFFDSFNLKVPKKKPAYLDSKAKMLLDDLLSADSATRSKACYAIARSPFTVADLPMLKQALVKEYLPAGTYQPKFAVNTALANKIAGLEDPSMVDFIRQQYPTLKNEHLKNAVLSVLAQTKTEKSYAAFTELLLSSVPAAKPDYMLTSSLRDSIALTARYYPQLQKLATDSMFGPVVAELALACLDSNYIKTDLVAGASSDFLKAARVLETKMKQDPDFFEYWIYDLLSVQARLNTPEANKLLLDFCTGHFHYLNRHAMLLLLKNKQPVPAATLDSLAADKGIRTTLYTDLKELKKTNLYPKKYFTQTLFAESEIFSLANDDGEASSIEFVQKKKATVKGKSYNFYLYKVTYTGEEKSWSYLGIVGGYDLAGKNPEALKPMGQLIMDEEFDANRVSEQFDTFLKGIEEEKE